ncbi:hypothetical protein D6827_02355 [Candidatus Parcubacteria bacterium]|nr:MAG: hypothetical protein D6827_02355 [Candidatus Parcubacteria bacterium]
MNTHEQLNLIAEYDGNLAEGVIKALDAGYGEICFDDCTLCIYKNGESEVLLEFLPELGGRYEAPNQEAIRVSIDIDCISRADIDALIHAFREIERQREAADLFTKLLEEVNSGDEIADGVRVWSRDAYEPSEGEEIPHATEFIVTFGSGEEEEAEYLFSEEDLFDYITDTFDKCELYI